jgi:hypothetical protein
MNPLRENDTVFPLSAGAAARPALRPPSLSSLIRPVHGVVHGRNSFLREWSARRAQLASAARGPSAAGR